MVRCHIRATTGGPHPTVRHVEVYEQPGAVDEFMVDTGVDHVVNVVADRRNMQRL
jgi:hypothetical protein